MKDYPKRPRFFAHRFCRMLFKQCAANEIGPEGCWLLAVIAHTEDAKGYRSPVTFFNMQLAPLVGLGSADALDRVRRKCIEAGWLHYEPGAKGIAGRYWVLEPDRCAGLDDGPTDEGGDGIDPHFLRGYCRENADESAKQPRSNREESADHSSLALPLTSLCPEPSSTDTGPDATTGPRAPEPTEPPVMTFPVTGPGPKEWGLPGTKVAEWREAFPYLDVLGELRRARQWCIDNPSKRKTARGMTRFLNKWLNTEQDRGPRTRAATPPAAPDRPRRVPQPEPEFYD